MNVLIIQTIGFVFNHLDQGRPSVGAKITLTGNSITRALTNCTLHSEVDIKHISQIYHCKHKEKEYRHYNGKFNKSLSLYIRSHKISHLFFFWGGPKGGGKKGGCDLPF